MKNSHKILENSLEKNPCINLALGMERGDLGKMERALKAGAQAVCHPVYGQALPSSPSCPFGDIWEFARLCQLSEEGYALLHSHLGKHC